MDARKRIVSANNRDLITDVKEGGPDRRCATIEEIEAELIRCGCPLPRGQTSEVTRKLQIGRSTLYRKLEALGLPAGGCKAGSEGVAGERQPRKIA